MLSLCLACLALVLARQTAVPPGTHEPPDVLRAEAAFAGADILLPLARSTDRTTAVYALRAVGRLEDVALVPALLERLDAADREVADAAAGALAQTMKRVDPQTEPATVGRIAERLRAGKQVAALGRLAYAAATDAEAAETLIAGPLGPPGGGAVDAGRRLEAAIAIESLARRNARLTGFSLAPATIERLDAIVADRRHAETPAVRLYTLRALVFGRALSASTAGTALADGDDQVRRVAVLALGTDTSPLTGTDRDASLTRALADPSLLVRFEAVQSFARRSTATAGCAPLLAALADPAPHVVNAALDALGPACPGDAGVTTRVAAEARTPPPQGPWQRGAHAFLALARRAPDRAAALMPAFARHPVWNVRVYAARAATALKDEATLAKLAGDGVDNVREAALTPLRAAAGPRADAALLDALRRPDYQLVRTAALLLKDTPADHRFHRPLADALVRITGDASDTSRDPRLALLDAIDVHGQAADTADLVPFLRDADPRVAGRAAAILKKWGHDAAAAPRVVSHPVSLDVARLDGCVAVTMKEGGRFRMRMLPDDAPVTVASFRQLVEPRHYYDGFTLHRVEPNFVVQGGGPGSNEYSGLKTYWRDEIAARNGRGAVGLSTRGRNTADGQIYIMLTDDPRLDYEFTIFAQVVDEDMPVVDRIQEGDAMATIRTASCR